MLYTLPAITEFIYSVSQENESLHYRPKLWKMQNNFSERELTFTFANCCRPSVCNARPPYSGGCKFRQFFYGIWYLGHPLTCAENFTEIVPGEPLRRGSQTQEG